MLALLIKKKTLKVFFVDSRTPAHAGAERSAAPSRKGVSTGSLSFLQMFGACSVALAESLRYMLADGD
jgi:hypothetical protein